MLESYLLSVLLSGAIINTYEKACLDKLKREGFRYYKEDQSSSYLVNLFYSSIPVFNLLLSASFIIIGDKLFDNTIESLYKQGKIYNINDVTTKEKKDESAPLESESKNTTNREKIPVVKFEDLSVEEQISCLEELKSQFLGLKENTISEDVLDYINSYTKVHKR